MVNVENQASQRDAEQSRSFVVPCRDLDTVAPWQWLRTGIVIMALSPIVEGDMLALVEYLAIGTVVGGIFALLTFAVAVVSLPLIADRDIDMITAGISSVNAVLRNKRVMLLWVAIIVVLTVIGFATAFIGLGIVMPWLAYARWHAYRDTLQQDEWPALP